jgi:hypothetical protein
MAVRLCLTTVDQQSKWERPWVGASETIQQQQEPYAASDCRTRHLGSWGEGKGIRPGDYLDWGGLLLACPLQAMPSVCLMESFPGNMPSDPEVQHMESPWPAALPRTLSYFPCRQAQQRLLSSAPSSSPLSWLRGRGERNVDRHVYTFKW